MTRALVLAALSSGAGKTVLTLALLRALRKAGYQPVSAKSGPDYIDPAFHAAATGLDCLTLDPWAMAPGALRGLAHGRGPLMIVEGAMGLFDGPEGARGSTADLAQALGAPVILILDVARQAQTAAALLRGAIAHGDGIEIAGVILNRIGSARHERMVRDALAPLGVPVLGAIPRSDQLETPRRHLGLVQARERADLDDFLDRAAALMAGRVDLAGLAGLARPVAAGPPPTPLPPLGQHMAIARDDAFAFLYPHLLEGWREAGAALSFFSPLANESPGEGVDAVFLPGGYPELHAPALSAATHFMAGVRKVRTVYGECGGYMVMGRGIVDAEGQRWPMMGLLPLETSFAARRLHLGYRRLKPLPGAPWPMALIAHEFHYASIVEETGAPALYQATDASGRSSGACGLRLEGRAGAFPHIIAPLSS